jgi:hypothetical protein
MKFKDLEFKELPDLNGGIYCRIQFDNGFGASIVKHQYSYGGGDGLYEIAVLDSGGEITYTTPITNDVLGYLSEEDVERYVNEIKNLQPNES